MSGQWTVFAAVIHKYIAYRNDKWKATTSLWFETCPTGRNYP